MQGSFMPSDREIRQIVQSVRLAPSLGVEAGAGPKKRDTPLVEMTDDENRAQQLDRSYALKVVGHALLIDMSKAWVTDNPVNTTLDQTLFAKLLAELLDRVSQRDLHDVALQKKRARDIGVNVRKLGRELREAWEEFDNYHVSAQIQSAEDCVVQDLRARGFFGSLVHEVSKSENDSGHKAWRDLVFVLRRSSGTCVEFARAVGAHIMTHNMVANNRSSIIEHNRSYNIFQNAFAALEATVAKNDTEIMEIVNTDYVQPKGRSALTLDYHKHRADKLHAAKDKADSDDDAPPVDGDGGMWPQI